MKRGPSTSVRCSSRRQMLRERIRIRRRARDSDAVVEMQLARAAVVVEPVGHVGILLEFEQRNAPADRVDRAGRDHEEVAGAHRPPVHQLLDRAIERGGAKLVRRNGALQAEAERRAGLRVEDVPALALALGKPARARLLVVRDGPGSTAARW